jgi:O-antigen/teichoic acid export membrane protein
LPKVIEVLYGAKWLPAVEYVQYLLPIAFLHPLYQQFKTHLIATNMVEKVNRGELYRLFFLILCFITGYIYNSGVTTFIMIVAISYIGCIYFTLDNICRLLRLRKDIFIILVLFDISIVFLNYATMQFFMFVLIFKIFEGFLYLFSMRRK